MVPLHVDRSVCCFLIFGSLSDLPKLDITYQCVGVLVPQRLSLHQISPMFNISLQLFLLIGSHYFPLQTIHRIISSLNEDPESLTLDMSTTDFTLTWIFKCASPVFGPVLHHCIQLHLCFCLYCSKVFILTCVLLVLYHCLYLDLLLCLFVHL